MYRHADTRFRRALALICLMLLGPAKLPAAGHTAPVLGEGLYVIHAGMLLADPGNEPLAQQSIIVSDGRIVRLVAGFTDPETVTAEFNSEAELVDLRDSFVLPGLMDAHVHIMAQPSTFIRNAQRGGGPISRSDLALTGSVYAQRTLAAGFTTIRDVGSNDESVFALRDSINAGLLPGPTILAAGPLLSPTGGHGDRGFDATETMNADERRAEGVCDGVTECTEAVRYNIQLGADLIKFTATGGFMSDTGTQQQFEVAEMQAIIDTAHMRGLKATAHAYGAEAAELALEAGVDSIEHGWALDKSALRMMKQQGAYLVPTLLISRPSAWADMAGTAKGAELRDEFKSFETAYELGVNIAFGTDVGIFDHGQNALEFGIMVELGMSEADAIYSATVATADLFGIADDVGTLEPGKLADIIAVAGNPLQDIEVLNQVEFVMKAGRVVKTDGIYNGQVEIRPVGKPVAL